jgi:hypothetical protein
MSAFGPRRSGWWSWESRWEKSVTVPNPETKKWTYTMTMVNAKVEVDDQSPSARRRGSRRCGSDGAKSKYRLLKEGVLRRLEAQRSEVVEGGLDVEGEVRKKWPWEATMTQLWLSKPNSHEMNSLRTPPPRGHLPAVCCVEGLPPDAATRV